MAKGKWYIRFGGIIEILIGVVEVALMLGILSQDHVSFMVSENVAIDAMMTIVTVYGLAAVRVIFGFVAVMHSSKVEKANIVLWCSGIIMAAVLLGTSFSADTYNSAVGYVSLVLPAMMMFGAQLNKKSA